MASRVLVEAPTSCSEIAIMAAGYVRNFGKSSHFSRRRGLVRCNCDKPDVNIRKLGKMTQRCLKHPIPYLAVLAWFLLALQVEASPVALEQGAERAWQFSPVARAFCQVVPVLSIPLQPLAWATQTPVFYLADLEGQGWALVSATMRCGRWSAGRMSPCPVAIYPRR
jgi:hypothetical protein